MSRPPELVRHFIHDALYNETDGYFQRHVNIFAGNGHCLDFASLRDRDDYARRLAQMYREQSRPAETFYQLWHTPSELFRPWYARGLARFILDWHGNRAHSQANDPLIIFEIGPGNGTLCADICRFIRDQQPELFKPGRFEYHLVEISRHLVQQKLVPLQKSHPPGIIHIHNTSFLHWTQVQPRPCFVLAVEVFDNLPQDQIRFAPDGSLLQGMVVTNDEARYAEEQKRYTSVFLPATDALILETVNALEAIGHTWPSLRGTLVDALQSIWPLTAFNFEQPWRSEFIPTGPFQFFKILQQFFPAAATLITDFDALPDTIPGHGAPVVQTRYKGETVACSTYLLQRGLFDIFFPINFATSKALLDRLGEAVGRRSPAVVQKHADFCRAHMECDRTATRSGYNPMLEDFENVSFLYWPS